MSQKQLKIHSENILPIIKQWLYSDKDIFLRELVSNACDALSKLRLLRDCGEVSVKDEDLKISIEIDKEKKMIKICDNGIGMTEEEVDKYIAQVAFSGAEEFMHKYGKAGEKSEVIGHFGLGFYSSFMVSSRVEIHTLSYLEKAKPAHWSCDGSSTYTLSHGTRNERGTEISLYIGEQDIEYLEEERLKEILLKYCRFLPYPISLQGKKVNVHEPLWIKSSAECAEKEYLDFYRALYPKDPEPIFWIHLNVDYPFHLKGVLYFPKLKQLDLTKSIIHLYSNRVFVSDQCQDLLPEHLTVLRGAIDSPDIPLNVSRSSLQLNKTVRQVGSYISKKIADRLQELYTQEKERFITLWPDLEFAIKLGILQDEKFYDKVKSLLIWKTSERWATIEEYLEKQIPELKDKIYYTQGDIDAPILKMYKEKGIEVLHVDAYLDPSLMSFLEHKLDRVSFQRIDGAIEEALMDKSKEKPLLDSQGKTEAVRIADAARSLIQEETDLEIEAKSLSSSALPAFVLIDETSRRVRDYFSLSKKELPPGFKSKNTFILNTNSPLIQSIYALSQRNPLLAKKAFSQLYTLSLLSQKELEADKLSSFIVETHSLLEELASLAANKTP